MEERKRRFVRMSRSPITVVYGRLRPVYSSTSSSSATAVATEKRNEERKRKKNERYEMVGKMEMI